MSTTVPTTPSAVLPVANDPCWCGSGRKYKRCHKQLDGRVVPHAVSPRREVPAHIVRPPYAETGKVQRWQESAVKTPEIIEKMRVAGKMGAEVLKLAGEFVRPGITTDEIDIYVHNLCIERNSYPSPFGSDIRRSCPLPQHPQTDPAAQEEFKKNLASASRRSRRTIPTDGCKSFTKTKRGSASKVR